MRTTGRLTGSLGAQRRNTVIVQRPRGLVDQRHALVADRRPCIESPIHGGDTNTGCPGDIGQCCTFSHLLHCHEVILSKIDGNDMNRQSGLAVAASGVISFAAKAGSWRHVR